MGGGRRSARCLAGGNTPTPDDPSALHPLSPMSGPSQSRWAFLKRVKRRPRLRVLQKLSLRMTPRATNLLRSCARHRSGCLYAMYSAALVASFANVRSCNGLVRSWRRIQRWRRLRSRQRRSAESRPLCCKACGRRGADVRPLFGQAPMGTDRNK